MSEVVYPNISYKIAGYCFNVHNELGRFCREKQYADKLEQLLKVSDLEYEREFEIRKFNLNSPPGNRVDFLVDKRVIIDLKAKRIITKDDYYQMLRYLRGAEIKLGFIVNFRESYLKPKRVLNSSMRM
jgi:GxxExxY protein